MQRARTWTAAALALMVLASPLVADIVPNEPETPRATDSKSVAQMKDRLETAGVGENHADRILATLRDDELEFFGRSSADEVVVGQEEIITMFWYEWVLGIMYAWAAWKFYDESGCQMFFPDEGCP